MKFLDDSLDRLFNCYIASSATTSKGVCDNEYEKSISLLHLAAIIVLVSQQGRCSWLAGDVDDLVGVGEAIETGG
jgi:hypothetical protein